MMSPAPVIKTANNGAEEREKETIAGTERMIISQDSDEMSGPDAIARCGGI
jgi:hypothetical protein